MKQLATEPKYSISVPKGFEALKDLIAYHHKKVIEVIEDMPTTYDVDKVVEELKKHKDTTDLNTVDEEMVVGFTVYQGAFNDAIDKSIEIVKQGGVSDDVCEYRITDKMVYVSCNNKQIASAFCWLNECGDYKYCPYCGKKIKVVE